MFTMASLDRAVKAASLAPTPAPVAAVAPAPVRVSALDWASDILGRFLAVADERQIAHARYLMADEELVGLKITPIGASYAELEARLAALEAPVACGECGEEHDPADDHECSPESWGAWADEFVWSTTEPAAADDEYEGLWNQADEMVCPICGSPCGETSIADGSCWSCDREREAAEAETIVPAGAHTADEIGWAPLPRRSYFLAPPTPVKVPALADGLYRLDEIVDGTAAYLRGVGSPVHDMMADRLAALAAEIRNVGAQSVREFEEKLPEFEKDLQERLLYDAFAEGFAQAESQMLARDF